MVQYERDCRTSFAGLDCLSVEWLFVGRNLDFVAEPDLEANFRLGGQGRHGGCEGRKALVARTSTVGDWEQNDPLIVPCRIVHIGRDGTANMVPGWKFV